MDAFSLKDKTALVTGGNTGIGLGIAEGLARAGARVAIHGRNQAKNAAALEALGRVRDDCLAFTHELTDVEGLPAFYGAVSSALGGVDILVNNAGITRRAPAEDLAPEAFQEVLRVDLEAPFRLAQAFARERLARGAGGCVLFIASLMSEAARPTVSAYTAAKGAIKQLVKALAVEWAPHGIRVNGIGPGYIRTDLTAPLQEHPELNPWILGHTPLGRWGEPQDLAGAAVFLSSDASAFVTGQVLYVDGGFLAAL